MSERMTDKGRGAIEAALAAFGSAIGRWPDTAPKAEARRALLADPAIRRLHDAEKRLDAGLDAHRARLDAAIAADGVAERVGAAVLARVRRPQRLNLGRLAAACLAAAFLGGAVDVLFLPAPEEAQIVLADTLVYGPETVEFR